jgi:hypothetical protein
MGNREATDSKTHWLVLFRRLTPFRLIPFFLTMLMSPWLAWAKTDGRAFDSWFWHASAAGSVLHLNDEGDPYRISLGAGRPLPWERLSLIGKAVYSIYDVNAVADNNPSPNIRGGWSSSLGIDFALRIDSLYNVGHANVFFEGGAGFQVMLEDPPFPADGSKENFTLFAGPGVMIPLACGTRLGLSLQWFHISNANLFSNNSGYDGVQLVLATEWDL